MASLIRKWFGLRRNVRAASRQIDSIESKHDKAADTVRREREALERATTDFNAVYQKTKDRLRASEQSILSLEEALAATRDELETAKSITIPGLVAANDVLITQMEKITRLNVAQTVMAERQSE